MECGTAYKVTEYISKDWFKQLERYIKYSLMLANGFYMIFDRVDKLFKHL